MEILKRNIEALGHIYDTLMVEGYDLVYRDDTGMKPLHRLEEYLVLKAVMDLWCIYRRELEELQRLEGEVDGE